MRTQLEASAPGQRTVAQFELVLDAFRGIYHETPTASKAPAAVAAVADLLAEKGRLFNDQPAVRAAVGQYEFLRKQYPASPQAQNALLLEAEICRQDLKDYPCAEDKFRQEIAAAPGTSFAEQATLELKELEDSISAQPNHKQPGNLALNRDESSSSAVEDAERSAPSTAQPPAQAGNAQSAPSPVAPPTPHHVVMITGMRHWSNPTSTRIAIDLGGQVEYEAARVPNPDRIFFDLHGARLAPQLNGHQVEVIDDGYLKRIRAAQFSSDVTRVVLDVTDVSQYSAFLLPNPWRLIIDIHSDKAAISAAIAQSKISTISPPNSGDLTQPISSASKSSSDNTIADVAKLSNASGKVPATAGPTSGPVSVKVPLKENPVANNVDLTPAVSSKTTGKFRKKTGSTSTKNGVVADAAPLPHAAEPTADGQRSLVRALGLKVGRIVIDAGHGGHDSGTLGPGGIEEKDVVLDVALRVGKLLHSQLGAEIVYTRDSDIFIPLETRTAIANKAQADLFLSIHANSSHDSSARGVETYYLNFTSDPSALDVAAGENAVSTQSVHQLSDLVRKIALKDKIDESREFATDVNEGLYDGLKAGNPGLRDRGVKKAPFVVLIGAQMPSILAEISFLTNPDDADELRRSVYRQRIAESLASGVERYLRGLSGTQPAAKIAAKASSKDVDESASR